MVMKEMYEKMLEEQEKYVPALSYEHCIGQLNGIGRSVPINAEEEKTLYETEEPDPRLWYNEIYLNQYDYTRKDNADGSPAAWLRLGCIVSMKQVCKSVEARLCVWDSRLSFTYRAGQKKLNETCRLSFDAEFPIPLDVADISFYKPILEVEWVDQADKTHTLTQYKEAFEPSLEMYMKKYEHAWPKKEKTAIPFDRYVQYNQPEYETSPVTPPPFDPMNPKSYVLTALFREPDDLTDCDYICRYGKKPCTDYPYIGLPSFGRITLKPAYAYDSLVLEDSFCKITKKDADDGGVKVLAGNGKYYRNDGFVMNTKKDGREITYSLATPWEAYLMEPGGFKKSYYDFDIELKMNLNELDESGTVVDRFTAKGIITSRQEVQCIKNNVFPIALEWGCLHEETKIEMADGSLKKIKEIRIGESVRTGDGDCRRVCNVWRGPEERMIHLGTERGETLILTDSHPVLAEYGLIRAGKLKPGDRLRMADGSIGIVNRAEWKECSCMVYNLDLEGGTFCIHAEGFLVGDMGMQNSRLSNELR